MKKPIPLPSQERLRELFTYEPETGKFSRRVRVNNRPVGSTTKPVACGYLDQGVDGKKYRAHRLIWRYVTGEDPGALDVDHRNRNRSDNSWSNLRLGTKSQNLQNMDCAGYTYHKRIGKWMAQIQVNKKSVKLGYFECPLMARRAYEDAKKDMHEWGW